MKKKLFNSFLKLNCFILLLFSFSTKILGQCWDSPHSWQFYLGNNNPGDQTGSGLFNPVSINTHTLPDGIQTIWAKVDFHLLLTGPPDEPGRTIYIKLYFESTIQNRATFETELIKEVIYQNFTTQDYSVVVPINLPFRTNPPQENHTEFINIFMDMGVDTQDGFGGRMLPYVGATDCEGTYFTFTIPCEKTITSYSCITNPQYFGVNEGNFFHISSDPVLQYYSLNGQQSYVFNNVQWSNLKGIYFDPSTGIEYRAVSNSDAVIILTPNGGFGMQHGYNSPQDIKTNPSNGDVYVIDLTDGGSLVKCSQSQMGGYGNGNIFYKNFLVNPRYLAIANNKVYVTDDNGIEVFDISTGFFSHLNISGDNLSLNPKGIAIDNQIIYVADQANNRIAKYDLTGKYIGSFKGQYDGPGNTLINPTDIKIVGGKIYIANSGENKIQVFQCSSNQRQGAGDFYPSTNNIRIFPNPSSGYFNVAFKEQGEYQISLYNATGIEVKKDIVQGSEYQISDETLTPGLYILHATHNGITEKVKVTIAK